MPSQLRWRCVKRARSPTCSIVLPPTTVCRSTALHSTRPWPTRLLLSVPLRLRSMPLSPRCRNLSKPTPKLRRTRRRRFCKGYAPCAFSVVTTTEKAHRGRRPWTASSVPSSPVRPRPASSTTTRMSLPSWIFGRSHPAISWSCRSATPVDFHARSRRRCQDLRRRAEDRRGDAYRTSPRRRSESAPLRRSCCGAGSLPCSSACHSAKSRRRLRPARPTSHAQSDNPRQHGCRHSRRTELEVHPVWVIRAEVSPSTIWVWPTSN